MDGHLVLAQPLHLEEHRWEQQLKRMKDSWGTEEALLILLIGRCE